MFLSTSDKVKQTKVIPAIASFLRSYPLHVVLLPLFFFLATYTRYYGLLYVSEFILPFLIVILILSFFYFLLITLLKSYNKAGLLTTYLSGVFLFFGEIKKNIGQIPLAGFISSYLFLLPLIFLIFIILCFKIRKFEKIGSLNLFLNSLLIIYLVIEIVKIHSILNKKGTSTFSNESVVKVPKAFYPDIYFIIPDSYPSSSYQKLVLNTRENPLDSALAQRQFLLLNNSTSNFQLTPFSVAAVLNMEYPNWIKDEAKTTPADYSKAVDCVKHSSVIKTLTTHGYKIYNLSIFDIDKHPGIINGRFLAKNAEQIIFHNTFWNSLKWDIIPYLFPSYIKKLEAVNIRNNQSLRKNYEEYNLKVIDSLKLLPQTQKNIVPKFIYSHLEMPHYPFYYDSSGKRYHDNLVFSPGASTDKEKFKGYIAYTNRILITLVDSILNNNNKCVIIIQSDHGNGNFQPTSEQDAFKNYSAFYFPDLNYHSLYDSMSNVNTFRVVFNQYFNTKLPLLKDTSITIR